MGVSSWRREERLLLAAVLLFVLNIAIQGLIEWQVQERDDRLSRLDTSIQAIEEDAEAIRKVADAVSPEAQAAQQEAAAKLFQQVDAIYDVLVGVEE